MERYNSARLLAFALYILVGALSLPQLATAVLVANFERLQQHEKGLAHVSTTQREWLTSARWMARLDVRRRRGFVSWVSWLKSGALGWWPFTARRRQY